MLGGRTAEELTFGEITTGAADDIEKASMLARTMVIDYGMSALGPISFDKENSRGYGEGYPISEVMQAKIDAEVAKIIDEAHKEATSILTKNKKKLDLVANTLLTKETLEGETFASIMLDKEPAKKSQTTKSK
jgi:cell division protease FtsH